MEFQFKSAKLYIFLESAEQLINKRYICIYCFICFRKCTTRNHLFVSEQTQNNRSEVSASRLALSS